MTRESDPSQDWAKRPRQPWIHWGVVGPVKPLKHPHIHPPPKLICPSPRKGKQFHSFARELVILRWVLPPKHCRSLTKFWLRPWMRGKETAHLGGSNRAHSSHLSGTVSVAPRGLCFLPIMNSRILRLCQVSFSNFSPPDLVVFFLMSISFLLECRTNTSANAFAVSMPVRQGLLKFCNAHNMLFKILMAFCCASP